MSRNSITPCRALRARSDSVWTTMPSAAGMQQDATGFGDFSISTKHILQLPAIESRWW